MCVMLLFIIDHNFFFFFCKIKWLLNRINSHRYTIYFINISFNIRSRAKKHIKIDCFIFYFHLNYCVFFLIIKREFHSLSDRVSLHKQNKKICTDFHFFFNAVEPRFNIPWFNEYFFCLYKKGAKMHWFNEFLALI